MTTDVNLQDMVESEHGLNGFFDAMRKINDVERVEKTIVAIVDGPSTKGTTVAAKARIIASLWASSQRTVLAKVLERPEFREPAVIGRACILLDGPRRLRQLESKLGRIPEGKKTKERKSLTAQANELRHLGIPSEFSASRSFLRVIRKWMRTIPKERLEFDCVRFDQHDVWHMLCDLAHPRPDDWRLDFFQGVVHGGSAPEGSFVANVHGLKADNVLEMLERFPALAEAYSVIRLKVPSYLLTQETRLALVSKMPFGDVLWNLEELYPPAAAPRCYARGYQHRKAPHRTPEQAALDEAIEVRIANGAVLANSNFNSGNFGKLLERMLLVQTWGAPWWKALLPVADELLVWLKARTVNALHGSPSPVDLVSPTAAMTLGDARSSAANPAIRVAVLGDASASMQVAINAACIVGAMMSALFQADLVFFNNRAFRSARHPSPQSAADVLEVAAEVSASCSTSPAAALNEFLRTEKKIDRFIVVTDEEENTSCAGMEFGEMFEEYRRRVLEDAHITFVSFLRPGALGLMSSRLRRRGIETQQLRFDPHRPDLSKFDALLGEVLSTASAQLRQSKGP